MTSLRGYAAVTAAYWAFMLTDGALRMLVLLHFYTLGFTPLQLAWLFVFYEIAGVVTNLTAGWLAARFGLAMTLYLGLGLQVVALVALTWLDPAWAIGTSVLYVMLVQGASGVAKDLAKTASKSAVKLLVPEGGLFKWVAALTGSKNAVKGLGFFVGAGLLATLGFEPALWTMAAVLLAILVAVLMFLPGNLATKNKGAKFREVLSKDPRINWLSAARLFLFGARDVWFVVALPIWLTGFLAEEGQETAAFFVTGAFMASWIIGYGLIQGITPKLLRVGSVSKALSAAVVLGLLAGGLAAFHALAPDSAWPVLVGLLAFGAVFAVNSSLHSYLILNFAGAARVTMDVGFYYMANAGGRLLGTILSGLCFQLGGLALSLGVSAAMVALSTLALLRIPERPQPA
ncbi:MFS transporter permease [Jannaschia pagri]|uniref:MFS transporter permease n=1 Tax=Jannaschia pagri TaxID=2829797 RepID=A0ABQ4NNE7_9RHOB|nr:MULTISPECIES: organoarsenical effux MFS transporter ArsJ [unclassified Jannaschia]GIT91925.1 MFS transporter permease [Jannaschia sp. AI_61]GIT95759.1 MFS transporter permease [Jannaschia sp. AI_62]